jgi:hypothetical protein
MTSVVLRIERLVLETRHAVDAYALELALPEAISAVVAEHGVPADWQRPAVVPVRVIDGFTWDGHGGEPGLARALAECLYRGAA